MPEPVQSFQEDLGQARWKWLQRRLHEVAARFGISTFFAPCTHMLCVNWFTLMSEGQPERYQGFQIWKHFLDRSQCSSSVTFADFIWTEVRLVPVMLFVQQNPCLHIFALSPFELFHATICCCCCYSALRWDHWSIFCASLFASGELGIALVTLQRPGVVLYIQHAAFSAAKSAAVTCWVELQFY